MGRQETNFKCCTLLGSHEFPDGGVQNRARHVTVVKGTFRQILLISLFLIHLKYILRNKLLVAETSQLILKRLLVFCGKMQCCEIFCMLSCPNQAALLQIMFQHSIFVAKATCLSRTPFSYTVIAIISVLIFNVQAVIQIGF